MIIEDTCTATCAYYKKYKMAGEKKTCPHYMETTWASKERPVPKIAHDCSHKRCLILQIDAFNRMLGLQQAAEEERNMQHKMLIGLAAMAQTEGMKPIFIEADILDSKQIEDKSDENLS
jgi:hypothetical protein